MKEIRTPEEFKTEIIECLIDHISDSPNESEKDKQQHAENVVRDTFKDIDASFSNPSYNDLLGVMKKLAVREMQNRKDTKVISDNFMKIAGKIKSSEYNKRLNDQRDKVLV